MFEVCTLLPAKSIDLIIADPPYNLTKSFNGTTFAKKKDVDYEEYTGCGSIGGADVAGDGVVQDEREELSGSL